jgi:hypothetical protein
MKITLHTIYFLFLFSLSNLPVFSQYRFQIEYTGGIHSPVLIDTLDNGYLLAGSTSTNTMGGIDGFVMKIDFSGSIVWSKVYGGSNDDQFLSMARMHNGNFILAGTTKSFIHSSSDSINAYLVEIDPNGVLVWSKSIGTNYDDKTYSIKETADSGFILAGTTENNGVINPFLVKLDSQKNIEWNHIYSDSLYNITVAQSVVQTSDSGYALTGYATKTSSPDYYNMFIVKTDTAGNVTNATHYINNDSTMATHMGVFGYQIIENNVGNLVVVGGVGAFYTVLTSYASSWLLIEQTTTGNIIHSKSFNLNTGDGRCLDIQQTNDGGYILGGYMGNYFMTMIKADANLSKQWCYHYDQSFTPASFGYSVKYTADNGFILAGSYLSGSVVRIVKTNIDGNSGCQEASPVSGGSSNNITLDTLTEIWTSISGIDTNSISIDTSEANIISTLVCINVGVDELGEENAIVVYPNPASSKLIINIDGQETITLTNSIGKVIFSKVYRTSGEYELDISGFATGVYFMKAGNRITKFVKQ